MRYTSPRGNWHSPLALVDNEIHPKSFFFHGIWWRPICLWRPYIASSLISKHIMVGRRSKLIEAQVRFLENSVVVDLGWHSFRVELHFVLIEKNLPWLWCCTDSLIVAEAVLFESCLSALIIAASLYIAQPEIPMLVLTYATAQRPSGEKGSWYQYCYGVRISR